MIRRLLFRRGELSPAAALVLGVVVGLGTCTLLPSVASAQPAAVVTHIYELNGSALDNLGGPKMELPNPAGLFVPPGYTFGAGEGPNLSNAINPFTYSIEMLFSIDDVSGFKKLIDFENLGSDRGLYNHDGNIEFFPFSGSADALKEGQTAHMVLTRNGITKQFIVYVDGVVKISFTDDSNIATFTETELGKENIIYFLKDDDDFSGEDPKGFLDRVRIYDGVLTDEQVKNLFEEGPPPELQRHFTGYDVKPEAIEDGGGKDGSEINIDVTLTDQFGTSLQTVKKAKRLLVPADKNGEIAEDIVNHLLCYDLKAAKLNVAVVNQFNDLVGPQLMEAKNKAAAKVLCVPSTKEVID